MEGTSYLMSVSVDNRPGHSVSIPKHGNVSDASDESTCSSFEMLLPDFSSLGIGGNQLKCDNKDASTCITPSPDVKHNDYRQLNINKEIPRISVYIFCSWSYGNCIHITNRWSISDY